ncbi:MAG TPA: GNAT family N-acetyltransferase [Rhodoferax sp.]
MQICFASIEDARPIAEIHVATWKAAYAGIVPADFLAGLSVEKRESYWREQIPLGHQKIAVAKLGTRVVGWIAYGASRDDDADSGAAEIWAIYVSPEFWSGGVGRNLWLYSQSHLATEGYRSVSLWVLAANSRAINFYRKAGFVPDSSGNKEFEIGGTPLKDVRYVTDLTRHETSAV